MSSDRSKIRDDAGYTKYVVTLSTVKNGVLTGLPGQHLNEMVCSAYGSVTYGYLPWASDGYCGLIVKPAETKVIRESGMPVKIVTEQEIIDWVLGMEQRVARGDGW